MEVFRLFGTISINKAAAIADLAAVNTAGASFGAKFNNVLTKIGKAGKLIFAGLAIAAGAVFVSAIKKAADFELAMAKVKAISGATADEFEALTEKAKQLGLDTAQTMTEIADGMEAFARAGFTATEIVLAMDGAVALAESQVMELAEAVRITGAVLKGMGLEASESTRVANALAAAASSSATTVDTLGESMKYLAPVMAALNRPMEEALTVIAKLGDAGLTGGRATRALSTALEGLADPTDEAADALKRLNIDTFDAEGNFIGVIELVGQLEESFIELGYTAEQKMAAMSAVFAGAAGEMNILIGQGQAALEAYQGSITGTSVAFDQQAAMLDTVSGQWQILKGSIELLLVTIGTKALPVIQKFVTGTLIPWVNRMTEAADGTSIFETAIKKIIAPFQWMIDNGTAVKNALIAIGAGLFVITAYTNPILLLVAGIASLVAILSSDDGLPRTAKEMRDFNKEIDAMVKALDGASKSNIVSADYYEGLTDTITEMKNLGEISKEVYGDIIKELFNLQSAVLQLAPEDMADAWVLGVDIILAKFAELYPELGTLRIGYIGVADASDVTAESTGKLNTMLQTSKDAIAEVNRLLAEYRAGQEGAADDTDDTVVAISALVQEYNDLLAALNETEEGSYEYALALQDLEKFHNALTAAAEYLAEGDLEVSAALQALITETMKYAREQDKSIKSTTKAARTIKDLEKRYKKLNKIMGDSPVGSVEYTDALKEQQAQYDELMDQVDYLTEANIEVAQSTLDHIATLEAAGIVTRAMRTEAERLADAQDLLAQSNKALYQSEHGLLNETLELLQAYDDAIDGGARQAEILERLRGIYDEVTTKVEALGDAGVTASGDLLLILAAFEKVTLGGTQQLTTFEKATKTVWENILEYVGETLGAMLEGVFNYYRDKTRAAEEHANRMLEIEEDYVTDLETTDADYEEDKAAAQLAYDRKLEDLARDHARAMVNASDYDAQQREFINYQDRLEDAKIDHDRKMTDMETAYTTAIGDLRDDRIEAIADEETAMEDLAVSFGEAMWKILQTALTAAKEELLILSITEAAKALAYTAAIVLGGLWAVPLQAQHAAAAAAAAFGGGALALSGALIGFKEGAVFDSPTLLPPHMVAESGVAEAYLPLSKSVFAKIGDGIVNALSPQQPMLAGAGNISIDMRGMYDGAILNVRSESDIELIAREHYSLFQSRLRSEGVRT